MSVDSIKNTIAVAFGVCLVSSILVSASVVTLKPKQEQNKKLDKIVNILEAGDIHFDKGDIEKIYKEKIRPIVIDIKAGKEVKAEDVPKEIQPANFNLKQIAKEPQFSTKLDPQMDIARIKTEPNYMVGYCVINADTVQKYILPLYGTGLWSTMYGFIAIDKDLNNVDGFTFYEQGETPGLGGEVDNPKWKAQWVGKKLFDDNWDLKIQVIKGTVDPTSPEARYEISGLSGATLTTRGVDNLVRFWLGKNGYGPFFDHLRKEDSVHE